MPGRKLQLKVPEVAAVIDERHAAERDLWRKNRLLAVKLAARGTHTAEEIADLCGIARGHLFRLIGIVRRDGLEAVLERAKPGPKTGSRQGLSPEVREEMEAKLEAGEFVTGVAAQRWLAETHGVVRSYQTVWGWLKKSGRSAVGAAPQPLQERPRGGPALERWRGVSGAPAGARIIRRPNPVADATG